MTAASLAQILRPVLIRSCLAYYRAMTTLMQSNPYLRSARARKKALYISVKTSSAVEGIRAPFAGNKRLRRHKDMGALIAYWKRRSGR